MKILFGISVLLACSASAVFAEPLDTVKSKIGSGKFIFVNTYGTASRIQYDEGSIDADGNPFVVVGTLCVPGSVIKADNSSNFWCFTK